MKLKTRIKRALAGFLREELLEYIGYSHNMPYTSINERFKIENIPFETVVMEKLIDLSSNNWNDRFSIEDQIHECKRQFAENVMNHIHVEANDLISSEHFMCRKVRFVLRVQEKKN